MLQSRRYHILKLGSRRRQTVTQLAWEKPLGALANILRFLLRCLGHLFARCPLQRSRIMHVTHPTSAEDAAEVVCDGKNCERGMGFLLHKLFVPHGVRGIPLLGVAGS